MGGLIGLVNTGLTKGMDNSSKKMGLTGIFLGWLFLSTVSDETKALLGLILTGSFLVVQGMYDWIDIWRNPKGLTVEGVVTRLSKKLAAASGYLVFLLQSDLSDDLKMKSGSAIVLLYLMVQGIHDGIKALRGEAKPADGIVSTQ